MVEANGKESEPQRARLLLLYEDVAHATELTQRLPTSKYELISCPTSASADGWIGELNTDLVLLDPPEAPKELLQTCETVRGITERPVVVLSTTTGELLIARVPAAGIDEYLVLPLGSRELDARITAIMRRIRRHGAWDETQQVGGMALSYSDHSAERDGRKVYLSPIEFRLLACLASAPGIVLTHQTLMSRVWGAEYVDSRHYLRLYIRYLREKLEDDPRSPRMILSEWGVGYCFQPPAPTAS